MVHRVIVVAAVAVLAIAPHAYAAIGGGKGARSSALVSGNFNSSGQSGTVSVTCTGPNCSGGFNSNGGNGAVNGAVTVATAEPLAALVAGLGLLGVRYLRRRR